MTRSFNYIFFTPIVLLLALTPLFLGSNRPFFWALWAAFSFALLSLNIFLSMGSKVRLVPINHMYVTLISLFALIVCYVAVQLIPIGQIVFLTGDGSSIVSRYMTLNFGNSVLGLLRWMTYGIIFFLVVQVTFKNQRRARNLLRMLLALSATYAVYGLVALYQLDDTILTLEKWAYQGFVTGPFVNRNSFATFLGIGIVVSSNFLLERKNRLSDAAGSNRKQLLNIVDSQIPYIFIGIIFLLIALILTSSRMGTFSTAIALAVVIGMQLPKKTAISVIAIAASVALFLVLVYAGSGSLFDRMLRTIAHSDARPDLYKDILEMIAARPFSGYGMGSFEYAYPLFHSDAVPSNLVWDLAHSTYLANWVEMGIVIGSLPVAIFMIILVQLFKIRPYLSAQGYSAIGCTILVGLHSVFDFSMEIHAIAIYATIILALGYSEVIRVELDKKSGKLSG